MTISTTASKVIVSGNGVTTVFAYAFLIPAGALFELLLTDSAGSASVISTSNYAVSGIGNPAGGTFHYPLTGSPAPTGSTLAFRRLLPLQQQTNLENQGAYYPQVVEGGMDWIVMMIQQHQETLARCIQGPASDSSLNVLPAAVLRASKALRFDNSGQPIVV